MGCQPSQAAAVSIRRSIAARSPPDAAKWFITIRVPPGRRHPPGLVERPLWTGNDAHHIRRKRDVKRRVGKFERGGVHHMEALDLRQPLRSTRAYAARSIGAEISMPVTSTLPGSSGSSSPVPTPTTRISPPGPAASPRPRRRRPAGMEGQIEDEVVDRRPAAIGRFRRMSRIGLRRVDRVHRRALPTSVCLPPSPRLTQRIIARTCAPATRPSRQGLAQGEGVQS